MNMLIMFAKYPEKGKVKTRLAKDIGDEEAVKLYKEFVAMLVKEHASASYGFKIYATPDHRKDKFRTMYSWISFSSQVGYDLGERMYNALRTELQEHDKVIIIGSDLPVLSCSEIAKAFEMLDNHDVVLGPAMDGGYYLIGMNAPQRIFSGIRWSTTTVLEQTMNRIKRQRLSHTLLDLKQDIDTVEDLNILLPEQKILKLRRQ